MLKCVIYLNYRWLLDENPSQNNIPIISRIGPVPERDIFLPSGFLSHVELA